jgi:hypothetical protein
MIRRWASALVLARTRLWTLNPVWRQERIRHQEMEVRVEVDLLPEGLDGDDDPEDEPLAGQGFEVGHEGFNGRPAEYPRIALWRERWIPGTSARLIQEACRESARDDQ